MHIEIEKVHLDKRFKAVLLDKVKIRISGHDKARGDRDARARQLAEIGALPANEADVVLADVRKPHYRTRDIGQSTSTSGYDSRARAR